MDIIQGLDKEILKLSSEEDIVHEIEETDLFCSHVELGLTKLDEDLAAIAPEREASAQMSKEPVNEPAEPVSHLNITSYVPTQSQVHDVGPQIKLPQLVLKKFNGDITKWCSFWDTYSCMRQQ